jgi:hypothetical protein
MRGIEITFFQMISAGVQDFCDAVQLGAPHLFHPFEAPVDVIETAIHMGAEFSQP